MAPTFGYWRLRGLGQPIRFLLAFTEHDHEEKFYDIGPAPDFDRSTWFGEKFNLGLDFPNLPYYIDGDVKITESNAILRFIGHKHGLDGKTDVEKAHINMLENLSYGLHIEFAMMCYNPNYETESEKFKKGLKDKLKQFSTYLGDKKFFLGDQVTLADFHMYEVVYALNQFHGESVQQFQNLIDFMARFEQLPKIKAYIESDKYVKYPFFAKEAQWGGN